MSPCVIRRARCHSDAFMYKRTGDCASEEPEGIPSAPSVSTPVTPLQLELFVPTKCWHTLPARLIETAAAVLSVSDGCF